MKKYGLVCGVRKANPYRRMAKAIKTNNVADNLVNRQFEACGPRKVLLTDITYIPFEGSFCYLSTETIIHSDQGCHYTSCSFIQLVKDKGLRQSMSRRGNCWDNAPQESFFGRMKDHIKKKLEECRAYDDVRQVIDDWMDYSNNDRYQWKLARLSPNEYHKYITTGIYPLKGVIPSSP